MSFHKNRRTDSQLVDRTEIIENQIVCETEFVEFRPFYTSSHVRSLIRQQVDQSLVERAGGGDGRENAGSLRANRDFALSED